MNRNKPAFAREAGGHAASRMERRSKRRIAKHLVARGLRTRRGLARIVLSGGRRGGAGHRGHAVRSRALVAKEAR